MSRIYKNKRILGVSSNESILSNGELFIENNNNDYRIKIGDGTSAYDNLPYSIGAPNMEFRDGEIIQQPGVNISDTITSAASEISAINTAINEDLSYVISGKTLSQIIGSLKSATNRINQAILNLGSRQYIGSKLKIYNAPQNSTVDISCNGVVLESISTDSNGYAEYVTDTLGTLSFSSNENIDNSLYIYSGSVTITYYGCYVINMNNFNADEVLLTNVSFDDAYGAIGNLISENIVTYIGTMFRYYGGSFADFYYSSSPNTDVSSLAYNSGMTQMNTTNTFYINNYIEMNRSSSNTNIAVAKFLKSGFIIKSSLNADLNSMAKMKSRGNIFSIELVNPNDTINVPYYTYTGSTWISYYAF